MKLKSIAVPGEGATSSAVQKIQRSVAQHLSGIPYDQGQSIELQFDSAKFPLSVAISTDRPTQHLHLTYFRNLTDDAAPTVHPFVDWIVDGNYIRIRGITGLTSGKTYLARFLAYA